MRPHDTDLEWERFGASDPYFGVIAHPRFHRENLSPERRIEFFESGRAHVQHVLANVKKHVAAGFAPTRVLDFGCGVGRLVIPFAELSAEVVGVDVSASMLEEARSNCCERGIVNAQLLQNDDALSGVQGPFDLVHSVIVFQHVPVARGLEILERLLDLTKPGGVGVLHFTYGFREGTSSAAQWIKSRLPGASHLVNLLRRRPVGAPVMQMNAYDLGGVLARVAARGATTAFVELTDHGGALGALLYFRMP